MDHMCPNKFKVTSMRDEADIYCSSFNFKSTLEQAQLALKNWDLTIDIDIEQTKFIIIH